MTVDDLPAIHRIGLVAMVFLSAVAELVLVSIVFRRYEARDLYPDESFRRRVVLLLVASAFTVVCMGYWFVVVLVQSLWTVHLSIYALTLFLVFAAWSISAILLTWPTWSGTKPSVFCVVDNEVAYCHFLTAIGVLAFWIALLALVAGIEDQVVIHRVNLRHCAVTWKSDNGKCLFSSIALLALTMVNLKLASLLLLPLVSLATPAPAPAQKVAPRAEPGGFVQGVVLPGHQVPFAASSQQKGRVEILTAPMPSLADTLTGSRQIAIFYDYLRESSTLSALLAAPAPSFTTLFVPLNSAIMSLPRKPHQGPPPSSTTPVIEHIAGSKEEEDAHREYLEHWMDRHVVNGDVDETVDGAEYDTMVEGKKVGFKVDGKEQKIVVVPGDIEVKDVVKVSNGKIIIIDDYADGQISDGTAGDSQARANAVCVDPFANVDLSTVSADDLSNLQTFREAAESAETEDFDPQIDAASGDAATALQNGKIANKVLKLTCEVQALQIKAAQGSDEASSIAEEQTKLSTNIALDQAAAGQAMTGVTGARRRSLSDRIARKIFRKRAASLFPALDYADGQISDGTAGDSQARANAVCVEPFANVDLSTVSADDLENLQTFREAAEAAETDDFNPQIDAASGDAATALQNGKIANKVLKLTCEVQALQIKAAQGSDEASDIAEEQTKLSNNIALDQAAAGQAMQGVAGSSSCA
ncbi:hypothetical protein MNV49_000034 [Pseudohyphozyma bogoriensis]|nr:hypothetical protein MNV49_000034 [Pseudohyphozyma bogoriensis]